MEVHPWEDLVCTDALFIQEKQIRPVPGHGPHMTLIGQVRTHCVGKLLFGGKESLCDINTTNHVPHYQIDNIFGKQLLTKIFCLFMVLFDFDFL